MNGYEIFLKNKKKPKRLSNTESSKNQDEKSQIDFQAKTGQGDRNDLQQSRLPQQSRQFYCKGIYTK